MSPSSSNGISKTGCTPKAHCNTGSHPLVLLYLVKGRVYEDCKGYPGDCDGQPISTIVSFPHVHVLVPVPSLGINPHSSLPLAPCQRALSDFSRFPQPYSSKPSTGSRGEWRSYSCYHPLTCASTFRRRPPKTPMGETRFLGRIGSVPHSRTNIQWLLPSKNVPTLAISS